MHENAFTTPGWLVEKELLSRTDFEGYTSRLGKYQSSFLNKLLSHEILERLIDHETIDVNNYSALELLQDVRKGLWIEANATKNVDIYRRNLQRAYIERMAFLMTESSDIRALARGELSVLKKSIISASYRSTNTTTKYHYKDCLERINTILDPK